MSTTRNSLSARSATPSQPKPAVKRDGIVHAPAAHSLKDARTQLCDVKKLDIPVSTQDPKSVPAFLHLPKSYSTESAEQGRTAAILLSGAGGGLVGPSSIYLSMADKLASLERGIPVLRMDYRFPARNKYCVPDVLAAMDYLESDFKVNRFVLVGWSFGGAPVYTVGGMDQRISGCATVASQTAETDGIRQVGNKGVPVLLLHGTGDRTLSPHCSQSLYERYGTKGPREVKLFEGDDHALTKNSLRAEELLCDFIMRCAGREIGAEEQKSVVQKKLIDQSEKVSKMREGGDLGGEERVE